MISKKLASNITIYGIPLLLFILSVVFYYTDYNMFYEFVDETAGYGAFYLLLIIVFSKPLFKFFKWKWLLKIIAFRRELGILMAYFVLIHGFGILLDKNLLSADITRTFYLESKIMWGLIAGIITGILGITSNNFSVKKLNKVTKMGWKKLHYLVYILVIVALIHIYFVTHDLYLLFIGIAFIILKILEFSNITINSFKSKE